MADKPNTAETFLAWLREASAHAFQTEAPNAEAGVVKQRDDFTSIDILVNEGTVGVRVKKGDRQEYQCITWGELERAESNPLIPLIDAVAALVRKGR